MQNAKKIGWRQGNASQALKISPFHISFFSAVFSSQPPPPPSSSLFATIAKLHTPSPITSSTSSTAPSEPQSYRITDTSRFFFFFLSSASLLALGYLLTNTGECLSFTKQLTAFLTLFFLSPFDVYFFPLLCLSLILCFYFFGFVFFRRSFFFFLAFFFFNACLLLFFLVFLHLFLVIFLLRVFIPFYLFI